MREDFRCIVYCETISRAPVHFGQPLDPLAHPIYETPMTEHPYIGGSVKRRFPNTWGTNLRSSPWCAPSPYSFSQQLVVLILSSTVRKQPPRETQALVGNGARCAALAGARDAHELWCAVYSLAKDPAGAVRSSQAEHHPALLPTMASRTDARPISRTSAFFAAAMLRLRAPWIAGQRPRDA
jgi:hypothetical protein